MTNRGARRNGEFTLTKATGAAGEEGIFPFAPATLGSTLLSPMKTFGRSFIVLFSVLLGVASLAFANPLPSMQVTVSDSAGKIVYKGRTDTRGSFTTANIAPGNYVVQFNAKSSLKGRELALVVGAGKKKVVANSVAGSKFNNGGVAMRIEVDKTMNLRGQVADAVVGVPATTENNARVKYIKGKKYVWVPSELGSNLGGRWVDANSAEGRHIETIDQKGFREFQDRSQPPPPPNGR